MDLEMVKDSEGAVIGFNLYSDCYSEDDFFIRNLPRYLGEGVARVEVKKGELVISNGPEGMRSFKIPEDVAATLKAYLESESTKPSIHLGGFGLRAAYILFENEAVRRKSLPKTRKTRKMDIGELKKFVSRMFGVNPRKARGILNSVYADTMQNIANFDAKAIKGLSSLLSACGFDDHARKLLKHPGVPQKTRCLFTIQISSFYFAQSMLCDIWV